MIERQSLSSMPSSAVFGATLNTDPIVVSDDGLDSREAPLDDVPAGSAFIVQLAPLTPNRYEESSMSVE